MAQLSELFVKSRVIVVEVAPGTNVEAAFCEEALAAGLGEDILWEWRKGQGIHPLKGAVGAAPLWGLNPSNPALIIDSMADLTQEAVLFIRDAHTLTVTASLKLALKKRYEANEEATKWVLLEGHPDKLKDLLSELNIATSVITARLAATPQRASANLPQPHRKLKIDDILDLDRFDSDDWTRYLNDLSLTALREICERKDDDLVQESRSRVQLLCTKMKEVFVDKNKLIDLMACSTVAHLPLLLLGPWGTAKSMLVRQFAQGLGISRKERLILSEDSLLQELLEKLDASDTAGRRSLNPGPGGNSLREESARYFEYLVTRFTTPEELLGTVDVNVMLRHSIYLRRTAALLPRAEIAFLDEVFKANSSILNALLSLINERLFYNAGVPWTVNLVMLFAASNEPPQEEDLGAFYDRFPVRAICDPVGNDDLRELVERSHAQQYLSLLPAGMTKDQWSQIPAGHIDPKGRQKDKLANRQMSRVACVNDFRLLRKVCLYRFGGADLVGDDKEQRNEQCMETFFQILRNVRREYDVSDRSCGHFFRLVRAKALLDGRDYLKRSDCDVLAYCGKSPEDARRLPGIIDDFLR